MNSAFRFPYKQRRCPSRPETLPQWALRLPESYRSAVPVLLAWLDKADEEVPSWQRESLLLDRSHGTDRQMLTYAVARCSNPRKTDVLVACLDDDDVAGHAVTMLARLAFPETRDALERFVAHPMAWVRKAAKKGIERIDKKLADTG